jgi:cytochrome b subunit of formate dehydrogenase
MLSAHPQQPTDFSLSFFAYYSRRLNHFLLLIFFILVYPSGSVCSLDGFVWIALDFISISVVVQGCEVYSPSIPLVV